MPDLSARDLTKEFAAPDGASLAVLAGASLSLDRSDSAAIVGPSGSGKSTFLSILGTLDRPTSGTVELDGVEPFRLSDADLARFRNRRIGFVFQEHHLLPQCTVLENVLVPLLAEGGARGEDVARGEQLLHRVGLAERLTHRPAQLSGGERQRAAIARALIREPLLVLADEPTGNLDRATSAAVAELLIELQAEQRTILIAVTHSDALAGRMGRRFELVAGRLEER